MSSLVLPSLGLKDHVGLPMYLRGEAEAEEEGRVVEVEEERVEMRKLREFRLGKREEVEEEVESSESSSIGAASSSSSSSEKEEEEEVEVESKRKDDGGFGSLDSLEDSLPIKRGLSNFFVGKSKSFASLADVVTSAREIAKPENPFNKRRRVLMMCKMRRASYSSLLCPPLPPLLSPSHAVEEADEEDEEEEEEDDDGVEQNRQYQRRHHHQRQGSSFTRFPPLGRDHHHLPTQIKKRPFASPRSFSLSDLQQHQHA